MDLKNADVRRLYDLKEVLYDQEWLKNAKNEDLYYMYRGVDRKDKLRYDITVILGKMLGKEFNKTKGHYHPNKYGELYIVLEGKAFYLMQKINNKEEIDDLYIVKAKKGDHVIVPPGYGHITINPEKEDLKMANWVYEEFDSIYKPIEEKKGAAYYYTTEGWIENKNYQKNIKIKFKKPLKEFPQDLSFLKKEN